MIAFKTGDIARYSQADGPLQLKIVFMSQEDPVGSGNYNFGLLPVDYQLNPMSAASFQDHKEIGRESQTVCGQMFLEMWSEDINGFPAPKGCFFSEDAVNPQQRLKQMHIVFQPRNHLKKNTRYMLVMNADVTIHLTEDYPNDGAIHIWSMDDVYKDPFRVIEFW